MRTAECDNRYLLTIDDVARILQCSTRPLHRLKATGQLPAAVRVRSLCRWRPRDIQSFISKSMEVSGCTA
jgi:predicted DNA-binding transcriptional regulator AlpA